MSKMFVIYLVFVWFSLSNTVLSLCRYRNVGDFPPEIFSYWSDWGCYTYTRPDLFAGQQLQAIVCYERDNNSFYEIPGLVREERCIPFSHRNEIIRTSVERTFRHSKTVKKWLRCCLDAELCCRKVMLQSVEKYNHCPAVWDGWSCFNQISAGRSYYQVCSQYAYGHQPPLCHHYSSKICHANGTWEDQTDYTTCDITPKLIFRTVWHMTTLAFSILVCIPAILIMIFYQNLHTEKLAMIRTLLIVIVLRNFFVLLVKGLLILDELTSIERTMMSENDWSCRMLTVVEKFFGTAVFTCMLMEGIYLYQMLTNVFRNRVRGELLTTQLYVGGFLATGVITMAWSMIMSLKGEKNCWQVTEGSGFFWILDGPRLIMLVLNFVLLVRIVWAIWSTFQVRQEEHHPIFRTAKAALICLPLLGVPFLFLIFRPETENCALEQIYYLFYYAVEALQGILIAILHCYSEREVKSNFSDRIRWCKKKFNEFSLRSSLTSRDGCSRSPTSETSRSSISRSSMQSRRESDTTSVLTLASPQTPQDKFTFPLPRIQEDDERIYQSGIYASAITLKERLSTGSLNISIYSKNARKEVPRRHSANETENDRGEESFRLTDKD